MGVRTMAGNLLLGPVDGKGQVSCADIKRDLRLSLPVSTNARIFLGGQELDDEEALPDFSGGVLTLNCVTARSARSRIHRHAPEVVQQLIGHYVKTGDTCP